MSCTQVQDLRGSQAQIHSSKVRTVVLGLSHVHRQGLAYIYLMQRYEPHAGSGFERQAMSDSQQVKDLSGKTCRTHGSRMRAFAHLAVYNIQQCISHVGLTAARCVRLHIYRVGQNHIYTVYVRYFWQENHQIYGHIRCIYTVLANPTHLAVHKI